LDPPQPRARWLPIWPARPWAGHCASKNLPADPELRERLLALGLRPGEVVTVLRRGQPGGILHLAHGLTEFMLRRQQAAEIRVTPA
jgi:ferrous iron transport protein A